MIKKILIVVILIGFFGCKSLNETRRFAKCQFRLHKITKLDAANVDLYNKRKLRDLSWNEGLRIGKSVAKRTLPINLGLSVDIKNTNKHPAALEGFDYKLFIDDKEVLVGSYDARTEVPPNSIIRVTSVFRFDLMRVVGSADYESLINIVLGLMNEKHEPVNITLDDEAPHEDSQ